MSDSDRDDDGYQNFEDAEANGEWWEGEVNVAAKGTQRWTTLSHNGVMFPPPYEPHGLPIHYEGVEFKLTPEEEEVATMFAGLREHEYYRQEQFRQNFFRCWAGILNKRPGGHPIRRLEYVNFDAIYAWVVQERETRKSLTREAKLKLKAEYDKQCAPFKYCLWDGKKEEVANYRVEPPGLFRGRGQHPLRGMLKRRVAPEDITINIDPTAPVPKCPPGHKWKQIVHNNTATWLAMWEDNVTGNHKYVMLGSTSSVKGISDREKFERARRLHKHIDQVREWYTKQWTDASKQSRQLGVATYFIDKLALRVGNEKSEEEADTVGCCSLRVEHVTAEPDNKLSFDFLGKDSVRYQNTVDVDPKVHELVRQFSAGKLPKAQLFDLVDPTDLNENFKQFMPDLSAKVFRTYNASKTLQDCFRAEPISKNAHTLEKVVYFNKANTRVAELCNHQKSIGKAHFKQMAALDAKEGSLKDTVDRLRKASKEVAKKGAEAVAREFFAAQDAQQWEWLNQYGTDEDKAAFKKEVEGRSTKPVKVKVESTPSKPSTKARTAGTKVKREVDSDDDVPIALIAKKKGAKAEPKKEEDEEDTKPAIRGKKSPAKKASPAKEEPAPAADEEDEDEEGEEEEEEDEEEEEEEAPAAKGKKPAAKKVAATKKADAKKKKKPAAKKGKAKAAKKKPAAKKGGKKK
jgi:DNA topoisomerase-1